MTSEPCCAVAPAQDDIAEDRNLAAWEAQYVAYLAKVAETVGFDATEDAASLVVRFMLAHRERSSADSDHPVIGPLLERAGARYREVRRYDFQFAQKMPLIEGVRTILAQSSVAPAAAASEAAKLAAVTAERDQMRAALAALMTCPFIIDPATVPRGKQPCEAPDQVVGNMSVSGRYYADALQALEISGDCWRPVGAQQPHDWQDFQPRGGGRFFQARWCPDHQLADGGAWEVKGESGYVHPAQAEKTWEFVGDY